MSESKYGPSPISDLFYRMDLIDRQMASALSRIKPLPPKLIIESTPCMNDGARERCEWEFRRRYLGKPESPIDPVVWERDQSS